MPLKNKEKGNPSAGRNKLKSYIFMKLYYKLIVLIFIPVSMMSQKKNKLPKSLVDYDSFLNISEEVLEYRKERLIPLDKFIQYASEENTIILDTRSEAAYNRKHLKRAIHLNFSEFSDRKLAKTIPSKETRILIYCNNNIDGDLVNFMTKKISMALNIPTFINLYGYGYKNVYELSSLVAIDDKRLAFEGSETE